MRKFNEFSALWRAAAFNRAFYQDVALNWRGIALRYLFLLVMLTWLVFLIHRAVSFTRFINHDVPPALETFPTITITKGVASSEVPQPYVMKDARGTAIFVLDTTGTTTNPADAGAPLLITRTELIQNNGSGMVQRNPLGTLPDVTLSRTTIPGFLRTARNAMIPGGLVCCGDLVVGGRILLALLFAAIGLAFNSAFHAGLTYKALLRLSIVSMTAPVLFDTLLSLCGVPFICLLWAFLQLLPLGYLAYAVKVAAEVIPQPQPTYPGTVPPPPPPNLPPNSDQFP